QLAAADIAHGLENGFRRDAVGLQLRAPLQIRIRQHGRPSPGQSEADAADQPGALRLALEEAVPIREPALLGGKTDRLPVRHAKCRDMANPLADLHAVRADVLHRGRADRARYQGQILESPESARDAVRDEIMPVLACARFEDDLV